MTINYTDDFCTTGGIWISPELEMCNGLSWEEKILIHKIDFFCDSPQGCSISNSRFANLFSCSKQTISKKIAKLRKLKIIKTVKFDGRKRYLKIDDKHLDSFLLNNKRKISKLREEEIYLQDDDQY